MRHPSKAESLPLFPLSDEDLSFGLTTRDLLRYVFKYWRSVTACLLLVTGITWCAAFLQPSIYESSGKVWVQTGQQATLSYLSSIAAHREVESLEPENRKIETETQLLLSRTNAEAVVARLGITQDQLIQTPIAYLLAVLPPWMQTWMQPAKKTTAAQIRNKTVDAFLKGISVEPLRSKTADTTSSVLGVTFDCADKSLAPRALGALLDEYVKFGVRHDRDLGESTRRLFDGKIQENKAELDTLDGQINALMVQEAVPLGSADLGLGQRTVTAGDPLDATLSGGRTGATSSLSLLKTETIEMQLKLQEAQQLFTEDSPSIRHLKEQLQGLRDRLKSSVRVTTNLDSQIDRLERERSIALAQFSDLRTKRDQVELYLQLSPLQTDNRLLTEAPVQPDKSKDKVKIMLLLLGPIAGLLLGILIAGFREYFDHRLHYADDVRRYLGLDTLGILPTFKRSS